MCCVRSKKAVRFTSLSVIFYFSANPRPPSPAVLTRTHSLPLYQPIKKAVFLYRGGSGCETLWKQIDHQHITLVEQSAEHSPAELILNARAFRCPRRLATPSLLATPPASNNAAAVGAGTMAAAVAHEQEEADVVGGLLIKLSLPSSSCSRELARLLQGLSNNS